MAFIAITIIILALIFGSKALFLAFKGWKLNRGYFFFFFFFFYKFFLRFWFEPTSFYTFHSHRNHFCYDVSDHLLDILNFWESIKVKNLYNILYIKNNIYQLVLDLLLPSIFWWNWFLLFVCFSCLLFPTVTPKNQGRARANQIASHKYKWNRWKKKIYINFSF